MHKFTTEELVAQKPPPDKFFRQKRNSLVFVLHNIRSLQNVGLFFRLADSLLVEKIYLTGYTGYPKKETDSRPEKISSHAQKEIEKTAIKLVPFVPWEQQEDVLSVLRDLRSLSYQIVGVEQTDKSVDYRKLEYKFPVALIFGHERTGVEDDILETCDRVVHIPMLGMGNSHNVAMSGTIIASHILSA